MSACFNKKSWRENCIIADMGFGVRTVLVSFLISLFCSSLFAGEVIFLRGSDNENIFYLFEGDDGFRLEKVIASGETNSDYSFKVSKHEARQLRQQAIDLNLQTYYWIKDSSDQQVELLMEEVRSAESKSIPLHQFNFEELIENANKNREINSKLRGGTLVPSYVFLGTMGLSFLGAEFVNEVVGRMMGYPFGYAALASMFGQSKIFHVPAIHAMIGGALALLIPPVSRVIGNYGMRTSDKALSLLPISDRRRARLNFTTLPFAYAGVGTTCVVLARYLGQ